ncbi:hypothetical protein [Desulfovibrio inopinatus]|uniref:hypothetical protein n=1 Tax=Desulfovibrio inopinatus TaxID=102109 RepID=UPI00041BA941|nr:hypothetical protein [Desulfovibrio inopinatus]
MSQEYFDVWRLAVTPVFRDEGMLRQRYRMNGDHPVFAGHFPGYPVLPGMMQLLFVFNTAGIDQQILTGSIHFEKCKYLKMILPDEVFEVACLCTTTGNTTKLAASLHVENELASSFRIQFSPTTSAIL